MMRLCLTGFLLLIVLVACRKNDPAPPSTVPDPPIDPPIEKTDCVIGESRLLRVGHQLVPGSPDTAWINYTYDAQHALTAFSNTAVHYPDNDRVMFSQSYGATVFHFDAEGRIDKETRYEGIDTFRIVTRHYQYNLLGEMIGLTSLTGLKSNGYAPAAADSGTMFWSGGDMVESRWKLGTGESSITYYSYDTAVSGRQLCSPMASWVSIQAPFINRPGANVLLPKHAVKEVWDEISGVELHRERYVCSVDSYGRVSFWSTAAFKDGEPNPYSVYTTLVRYSCN